MDIQDGISAEELISLPINKRVNIDLYLTCPVRGVIGLKSLEEALHSRPAIPQMGASVDFTFKAVTRLTTESYRASYTFTGIG